MAKKFEGIVVTIGGDTTPLDKALAGVNKKARNTTSELREVEKALKMDPGNSDLIRQKAELMNQAFENTKEKLDMVESAAESAKKQLEAKEITPEAYRAFERELITTRKEFENLQETAEDTDDSLIDMEDTLNDWSDSAGKAADKMKVVSAAAAGLVTAAVATVEKTEEFREDLSKLEANAQRAGYSLDDTQAAMKKLAGVTGETDSNVEALSNLMQVGFGDNNQITKAVDLLSGAVLEFPDTLKIESLADSLQETVATGEATGQFAELLGRLGYNLDEVNSGLASCATGADRAQFAMDYLARAGLQEVYESYAANNSELMAYNEAQYNTEAAMAQLADAVQPLVSEGLMKLADIVGKLAEWFGGLSDKTKKFIAIAVLLAATLAPALKLVSGLFQGITGVFNAMDKVSTIGNIFSAGAGNRVYLTFLKWAVIIAAVAATIAIVAAAISALIGKGEEFEKTMNSVGGAVKNATPDIPKYASGTAYHTGGLAWVGEQGPELVSLPRGAQVYTADQSARIAGVAGGTAAAPQPVEVGITFTGSLSQLARILKPELDRQTKLTGGALTVRGS